MKSYEKTYIMIGGTFLPAFIGLGVVSLVTKEAISVKSAKFLITFAVASAIGGWITAQMIKNA